ncbi:MAG: DUF4347 domain-containing protein [Planctomycetota bacterium]
MKDQTTQPSPIGIVNPLEETTEFGSLYQTREASRDPFEAAFIDSSIDHLRERLESLPTTVLDIVFLSPVDDGLQQIAAHLTENPSLTGVHLLAPCCRGEMMLGDQLHSVQDVQAQIQVLLDRPETD